ncbi:MAG: hypothetical protein K2G90_05590 [Muribaculaceae bacterium]|nr:hypothetical protein [Muribaculaceae bacterium]
MKIIPLCMTLLISLLISSCSSIRSWSMGNMDWCVNDTMHYIHDSELNWVFNPNTNMFSAESPVYASDVKLNAYPELKKYLSEVISDVNLPIDTVFLYLPLQKLIFASLNPEKPKINPVSIILFPDDDSDTKNRQSMVFGPADPVPSGDKWMLGNVFPNTKKKRAVISYRFPYNGKEIALLRIIQGHTPEMEKLSMDFGHGCNSCYPLTDPKINPSIVDFAEIIGWYITSLKKQP